MSGPEARHSPEAETIHRASVYLHKTDWLHQADEESIDEWRHAVSEQLIDVTSLLKDVDPFYDLSTLKEVHYKEMNPEAEDVIMISRRSIMLWKLPGTLCTAGECFIGMDDLLYIAALDKDQPRIHPQLHQKHFFDLSNKDIVFLEDSLNRVMSAYIEDDDGVSFYDLFKKK